jgi:protein involved in polysaccharide export with SLBB domain
MVSAKRQTSLCLFSRIIYRRVSFLCFVLLSLFGFLSAVTIGCHSGPQTAILKGDPPKGFVDTRVGPGDVLEITLLGEEGLPTKFRVEADGTLDYPYVKQVKVEGLTPPEIGRVLAGALSKGYFRNPQVHVLVTDYKSKKITVFGQVKKPGVIAYSDNMNIIEAVTEAGGFTEKADKNSTTVTRLVEGRKHRMRVKVRDIGEGNRQNFMLKPGDVIFVPERLF